MHIHHWSLLAHNYVIHLTRGHFFSPSKMFSAFLPPLCAFHHSSCHRGRGSSVGRALDSWWTSPRFDSCGGHPLPIGWVGVSIMWPAETALPALSCVWQTLFNLSSSLSMGFLTLSMGTTFLPPLICSYFETVQVLHLSGLGTREEKKT